MKIIGFLIIINSLIVTGWWVSSGHNYKWPVIFICGMAVIVGIFLIIQDRVIEISFKGIGTIKAAAKQADTDAKSITKIKQRIEAQSATIDAVALTANQASQLVDDLDRKNTELEVKVGEIDKLQEESSRTSEALEKIARFSTTVLAAQNDDRVAFDNLKDKWGKSQSPLGQLGRSAYVSIRSKYHTPITPGYINVNWKEGINPGKISISECFKALSEVEPMYTADIVNKAWNSPNIAKSEKMAFFLYVAKQSTSLTGVFHAGKLFVKEAGDPNLKWDAFQIDPLLEWWEKNKDSIIESDEK